uniref:PHD finger protein 2 n=1 Tax=Microcebus murinus TaxID=30608 RepID=A0A8C5W4C1_MICMU
MATVPVYCVCRLPYDVTRFMIECDACKDWFHGSCVGVEEEEAPDIDIYHCPNCEKTHGKSTLKKKRTWHKHGPGQAPDVKPNSLDLDDYEEEQDHLDACFKDSEYVYPSLESDEDNPVFKSRSKKRKGSDDAPYSPTARVGPSVPRQDRPVREGTRVASIETGLAAAAAKLSQQEEQKSRKKKSTKRKLTPNTASPSPSASASASISISAGTTSASTTPASTTPASTTPASATPASTTPASTSTASSQASQEGSSPEPPPESHSSSLADHEYTAAGAFAGAQAGRASQPMAPGVFLTQRRPSASSPSSNSSSSAAKGKRTKKGMATAKQRLGKILKIHRNGKLLL